MIFEFQKQPLGRALQNSWQRNQHRQLKNTGVHHLAKLQDVRRLKYAKEQFFGKTIFSKYHCDFLILVLQGATEDANKKTFS